MYMGSKRRYPLCHGFFPRVFESLLNLHKPFPFKVLYTTLLKKSMQFCSSLLTVVFIMKLTEQFGGKKKNVCFLLSLSRI